MVSWWALVPLAAVVRFRTQSFSGLTLAETLEAQGLEVLLNGQG